jgi:hypothetical protein
MEILRNRQDKKIIINQESDFKTDLGWQDNLIDLENESISKIINPIDNYETMRYIHEQYPMPESSSNNQNDIWFYFYFYNITGTTFSGGLDYNIVGITHEENSNQKRSISGSFFRLEFYKTPNDEVPDRINRKLVFAKNLTLPLGEKYYYINLLKTLYVPVFMGSSYVNKENMYLFWFQDETVLSESNLNTNTFWMSAKFFNQKDGTATNFTNKPLTITDEVVEVNDIYYKIEINRKGTPGRTDFSYEVFKYNGLKGDRVGMTDDPIKFYEMIN